MKLSTIFLPILLLGATAQTAQAMEIQAAKELVQNHFSNHPADICILLCAASVGAFFAADYIMPKQYVEHLTAAASVVGIASSGTGYLMIGK